MQDNKLYEYAIIRVVPRPDREEFFNIGLILFSKREKCIMVKTFLSESKLKAISPETDFETVEQHLTSFENVAKGQSTCSPIATMEIPERFRWLTATRSSMIQTSRPHPGFARDLEQTFDRLYNDLVL